MIEVSPTKTLLDIMSNFNINDDATRIVLVDDISRYIQTIIGTESHGIEETSEPLNKGEYIFNDGNTGNKLVVGIQDYVSDKLRNQYTNVVSLMRTSNIEQLEILRSRFVTGFLGSNPVWIAADVFVGLPPFEPRMERGDDTNAISKPRTFDIIVEHLTSGIVDNVRNIVGGKLKTDDTNNNAIKSVMNDINKTLPNDSASIGDILDTVLYILRTEDLIKSFHADIVSLKSGTDTSTESFNIGLARDAKHLWDDKRTIVFKKYGIADNESRAKNDKQNHVRTAVKSGVFTVEHVQKRTKFTVERDSASNTCEIKTTANKFPYTNEMAGHVFNKMVAFSKFYAISSFESLIICAGLLMSITQNLDITVDCGFVNIGILDESIDLDSLITDFRSKKGIMKPNSPNNIPLDQNNNTKPSNLDWLLDEDGRNMYNSNQKSRSMFLISRILKLCEVVVEENDTKTGESQMFTRDFIKNQMVQSYNDMPENERDELTNTVVWFTTECTNESTWDLSKLTSFFKVPQNIYELYNGRTDYGVGVFQCLRNMDFIQVEDTIIVEDANVIKDAIPNNSFDLAVPDTVHTITFKSRDGMRYIPVIVRERNNSFMKRFMDETGSAMNRKYNPKGSVFNEEFGSIIVNAIKPFEIAGTTAKFSAELFARLMSIFLPPIAIASNIPAMPLYYWYTVSAYNDISQYSIMGIGQIFGLPMLNIMKTLGICAEIAAFVPESLLKPYLIKYIEYPVCELWSSAVQKIGKDTLTITNDIKGVEYPTRFLYMKQFDRVKQYGTNRIMDKSDKEFVAKLIVNEYMCNTEWDTISSKWDNVYKTVYGGLTGQVGTIIGDETNVDSYTNDFNAMFTNQLSKYPIDTEFPRKLPVLDLFGQANKKSIFADYLEFIRMCGQNSNVRVRISNESSDITEYIQAIGMDTLKNEPIIRGLIKQINDQLGGTRPTTSNNLNQVIESSWYQFTEFVQSTASKKTQYINLLTIFEDTLPVVKELGEKLLGKILE